MSRNRSFSALLLALALVLAACGGDGGDAGDSGDGGDAGTATGEVSVTGTDDLKFEPSELTAAAGEVTVEMTCQDAIEHTFVIDEAGGEPVVECAAGETTSGTSELEAGTYTFYCDIPGHREAGMEGTLTVEE